MNGLLVIDKPAGMTSRDVVNRVQRWFPRKTKIGHTGTLDPLATGVLVVCIGAATRLADYIQAMGKTYVSRFRLGATSTTDDADGEMTEIPDVVPPTREQIDTALASFVGYVHQAPPVFSAVKVHGERAYDLARLKKGVTLGARHIHISSIRVLAYDWPFLDVEIHCGKGTYIRSIARDLGAKLGCGGLVQTLRRTRIGPFTVEEGLGIHADPTTIKLRPMLEAVPDFVKVRLSEHDIQALRQGQKIRTTESDFEGIAVMEDAGKLVLLGVAKRGYLWPKTVLG